MKIQINSTSGTLIFEYDCKDNTIKKTVEEAVRQNISLSSAYLLGADLRSANLSSANLSLADLRYANLSSAYLLGADLRSADLSSANLRLANLYSADLRAANLRSANLSSANLSSAYLLGADLRSADLSSANLPIFCKWSHSIQDNKIKIGCKIKTIQEWDLFFNSDEIYETERNTQEFKQIEAVFLAYKAYITHLNEK